MAATRTLVIGAVAYDQKVVPIWESMREYFAEAGQPIDYVLFSNYERQVDALFAGQIDIAWNTNLAYVRCEERAGGACQVLGMRDTDLDFTTRLIARTGSGVTSWADLRGKRLAIGSRDSVQAAVMPLQYLREAGLEPDADVTVVRFNTDVGKHGDTGTSELDVLQALHEGQADAGAVGYTTWLRQLELGRVNASVVESVWTSAGYNHCNFTALPGFDADAGARFSAALLAMDGKDPRWARLMELEGLNRWRPGEKAGYGAVFAATGIPSPK
ncbi:MAG: phosphate/phosphite/phosphonate ABC transporter substrate-binding protein [Dehalococcoidia bacterium]